MLDGDSGVPTEIAAGLVGLLGTAVGALVWVIKRRAKVALAIERKVVQLEEQNKSQADRIKKLEAGQREMSSKMEQAAQSVFGVANRVTYLEAKLDIRSSHGG